MLHSEDWLADKLLANHGNDIPKVQLVHFMVDMQQAVIFDPDRRVADNVAVCPI